MSLYSEVLDKEPEGRFWPCGAPFPTVARFTEDGYESKDVCLGSFLALVALQFPQLAHGQARGREVASTPEAEADRPTAQVTVDGRALFRVRGFSAYPAEERAEGIAKRIVAIANDPAVAPGSLQAVEADHATNVLAGDRIIMAVTDADVSLEGVSCSSPRPLS